MVTVRIVAAHAHRHRRRRPTTRGLQRPRRRHRDVELHPRFHDTTTTDNPPPAETPRPQPATTPGTTQPASRQRAFDFEPVSSYDQQQVAPGHHEGPSRHRQVKKREGPYAFNPQAHPQHEKGQPEGRPPPHPHPPRRYNNHASSTATALNTRQLVRLATEWLYQVVL